MMNRITDTNNTMPKAMKIFGLREPGSALTHMLAALLTFFAAFPLLKRSMEKNGSFLNVSSLVIFCTSMFLLYLASTLYHSLDVSKKVIQILRKFDHMMIYVLIAGSYTPICLVVLGSPKGTLLLSVIWLIALAGILINALWINYPKWIQVLTYIAMGWACIFALGEILEKMTGSAFLLLLAGGIIYTAGGVIYALTPKKFNLRHPNFGTHEIFHLFVMGGSACHYFLMYHFVV